jgi:hypothetical protein
MRLTLRACRWPSLGSQRLALPSDVDHLSVGLGAVVSPGHGKYEPRTH